MIGKFLHWLQEFIKHWIKPATPVLVCGVLSDFSRSLIDLVVENALLRQQLIVLKRQIKRPELINSDRFRLVFLFHFTKFWKQSLHIIQPEILLRWHRELFRIYWWQKSQGKPKVSPETISLIQKMAKENHLWGAERIGGELLKLGIEVSKRTIQKYMPEERGARSSSHIVPLPLRETWATFLKNQAGHIWACDFTVVYDWLFRQWISFVVMELKRRRIVHTGVTKFPTDEWTAQQLREATPWRRGPKYLIRDRDSKYATHISAMAISSGIQELKTPYRTPQANGVKGLWVACEENVWIKFSSTMAGMYSGWSENKRHTSIKNDRIRVLASVFPHSIICRSASQQVGGSSRIQFLVDCITAIRVRLI